MSFCGDYERTVKQYRSKPKRTSWQLLRSIYKATFRYEVTERERLMLELAKATASRSPFAAEYLAAHGEVV